MNTNNDNIYFFLSFDLVNSTEYKVTCSDEWKNFIINFYNHVTEKIEKELKITPWKKEGDEILFYFRLSKISSLPNIIKRIYFVMEDFINIIPQYDCAKDTVSVKGTLWLGEIGKTIESKNIIFKDPMGFNDFIGPDIDMGFRLASKGVEKLIVIDPKIYWLLSKINSSIIEDIKLLDYVELKGVWEGNKVPLFFYNPSINDASILFPNSLERNSEQINKIINKDFKSIKEFENEIASLNLSEYFEQIFKKLS